MSVTWLVSRRMEPIPADLLAREMLLGTATTRPDGSLVTSRPDGPQAHLATQGAATAPLPTHFHGVDQFQYFTDGSGTVGGHHVAPGIVHYTDRLTVYGPLRAGADGMAYLALRPAHDPGASFMPRSRQSLTRLLARSPRHASDRRNLTVDLRGSLGAQRGTWIDLVEEPDELRVAVCVVEAGAATEPVTVAGAGAYAVVVEGTVDDQAGPLGVGALAWCSRDDTLAAGAVADHTRLALLQFPKGASPA
ncbi:MAG: hypothetical protein E6G01_16805 [Actinobacteria bacterium]|nr:MAG: hypothetical protein E6G01_16805 [Actinomycetota bacterium]